MAGQHIEPAKQAIDGTIGVGAVTSPFWLALLEQGLGFYVAVCGAVLVTIRLAIAWRDWRRGKKPD